MWEDLSLEEYVMAEENFNEKGARFSSIIIKKNELFMLKHFLVISTIYSTAFVIQGLFLRNWDKVYALV